MKMASVVGQRKAFSGTAIAAGSGRAARSQQPLQPVARAVTQKLKAGPKNKRPAPPKTVQKGGTQRIGTQSTAKKLIAIANLSKEKKFRQKADSLPTPKLLARVEQLRLLSKLEELKLLSLLQRNGITLTFIEQSGLLETAESLGLLSAAADRNTPGLLFSAAFALFAAAPAAVYFLPDTSNGFVAAQVAIVAIAALGGTAAFAGGSLLSTLQKEAA